MKLIKRGPKWYVDARIDGVRRRISTGTTDHAEAKLRMAGIIADAVAHETANHGPGMTLEEGFKKLWLEEGRRSADSNGWKQRTDEIMEHMGRTLPLHEVTRERLIKLQAYLASLPGKGTPVASYATVNRKMAHIHRLLNAAAREWGVIDAAPVIKKLKTTEQRREAVTGGLLEEVLEVSTPEMRWFWVFLAETGLRRGEWRVLEWEHIDLKRGKITLTPSGTVSIKAGNQRVVWLTEGTLGEFTKRRERGLQSPLEGITVHTVRRAWDNIRKALGREGDARLVPYSLRHGCATSLINKGIPTATVQKWMGHSQITTTLGYVHHSDEDLRACIAE